MSLCGFHTKYRPVSQAECNVFFFLLRKNVYLKADIWAHPLKRNCETGTGNHFTLRGFNSQNSCFCPEIESNLFFFVAVSQTRKEVKSVK